MRLTKQQIQLKKRAIVMDVGGFRPPEDPFASWFGKVILGSPGQEWPSSGGKPMHPLCQINLTELPFKPPQLEDLAMITVFIGPDSLPVNQPNGDNWCLRTFNDLAGMVPLPQQPAKPPLKAFPLRARIIEADFPSLDDASEAGLEIEDDEAYQERCPNVGGIKFGGWPTLVQSTIDWPPAQGDDICPQYVFQIDSCQKAHWQWGDAGVGYFARGTTAQSRNQWLLTWQCL